MNMAAPYHRSSALTSHSDQTHAGCVGDEKSAKETSQNENATSSRWRFEHAPSSTHTGAHSLLRIGNPLAVQQCGNRVGATLGIVLRHVHFAGADDLVIGSLEVEVMLAVLRLKDFEVVDVSAVGPHRIDPGERAMLADVTFARENDLVVRSFEVEVVLAILRFEEVKGSAIVESSFETKDLGDDATDGQRAALGTVLPRVQLTGTDDLVVRRLEVEVPLAVLRLVELVEIHVHAVGLDRLHAILGASFGRVALRLEDDLAVAGLEIEVVLAVLRLEDGESSGQANLFADAADLLGSVDGAAREQGGRGEDEYREQLGDVGVLGSFFRVGSFIVTPTTNAT